MFKIIVFFNLLLSLKVFKSESRNNVCKDFIDYLTIHINKDCWYNPRLDMDIFQIILFEGYSYESHFVTTEDGYIIHNIRVQNRTLSNNTESRGVVILLHGIHTDSLIWTTFGKNSLAFLLVDLGYDVWMYNSRGTNLSSQHEDPNISYDQYWDFSFHEMGLYDVPASITQISEITKSNEIIIVGHSMGSTISYIYSILRKNHAENHVKALISLAPIAFLKAAKKLPNLFGVSAFPITDALEKHGHLVINEDKDLTKTAIKLCSNYPSIRVCYRTLNQLITIDGTDHENQILPETIPFLIYILGGIIFKSSIHFSQIILNAGVFKHFDYGFRGNLKKYGTIKPPPYNVTEISLPVHLLYAENDPLSTEEDTKHLFELIGSKNKTMSTAGNSTHPLNHLSFIYSKNITTLFYPQLIDVLGGL